VPTVTHAALLLLLTLLAASVVLVMLKVRSPSIAVDALLILALAGIASVVLLL
jgi:hypothetical protein